MKSHILWSLIIIIHYLLIVFMIHVCGKIHFLLDAYIVDLHFDSVNWVHYMAGLSSFELENE